MAEWDQRHKHRPVKGKYGEPQHWDGLTAVFVMLAERLSRQADARRTRVAEVAQIEPEPEADLGT